MTDDMGVEAGAPAEWAIERARKLTGTNLWTNGQGRHHTPLETFARYIEQHEKPPVDPVDVALAEVLRSFCPNDVRSYRDRAVAVFRNGLERNGLYLSETPNDL